jgi:hypothetical protein
MNTATNLGARQTGATLIVGLVLLLLLTIVGVSGMNTATFEVAMSGSSQYQQDAFQMAEDGIDIALAQRGFTTSGPRTIPWLGDPHYDRRSITSFVTTTPVPDAAFSAGTTTGSVQAFHFDIVSEGRGARNASSTHTQSFYVLGPGGS